MSHTPFPSDHPLNSIFPYILLITLLAGGTKTMLHNIKTQWILVLIEGKTVQVPLTQQGVMI